MTKFNPKNKDVLTFGEVLSPAMEITDQADADQYFKKYVEYLGRKLEEEPREDDMTAEQIAKINLGYYAGYYSHETRMRVEQLFSCVHPFFGKAKRYRPTALRDIDRQQEKHIKLD